MHRKWQANKFTEFTDVGIDVSTVRRNSSTQMVYTLVNDGRMVGLMFC